MPVASPAPVVLFGLGAIGRRLARAVLKDRRFRLAGAVDIRPDFLGRPLGAVLEPARAGRPRIVAGLAAVRGVGRGRVLLHASGSRLAEVAPQIETAVRLGYAVVSSCEELAWPWEQSRLAGRLDRLARRQGVAVLAAGVNPGFVMDALPVALSSMCLDIRHLQVARVVDAGTRRLPLQRKVGAGLSAERFRQLARAGQLGHVGLKESARLIAAALGWRLGRLVETLDPVISSSDRDAGVPIRAGEVAGLHQVVVGSVRGREVLRLDLTMAVGASGPHDTVEIQGTPTLRLRIDGGTPGDEATIAALLNAASHARRAVPGLHTALTLALPSGRAARGV